MSKITSIPNENGFYTEALNLDLKTLQLGLHL